MNPEFPPGQCKHSEAAGKTPELTDYKVPHISCKDELNYNFSKFAVLKSTTVRKSEPKPGERSLSLETNDDRMGPE